MTRNSKNLASASFLASIVILAACVDGGGSSGAKPGGSIELSNMEISGNAYIGASAVFIAYVDTSGAPVAASVLPEQKADTCTGFEEPTPTPILESIIKTKDVGGIVSLDTLTAGEIRLERNISGDDEITYTPEDVIDGVAMGKSYDITLGGGGSEVAETTWTQAFKMPAELSFDGNGAEGVFEIPQTGALDLTWDATGADLIALVLYGAETDKLATCIISDDGEFTIPASLIADLDEYGSITAQAISEEHKILDGRRVNLVGRSGFSMGYQLVEAPTPTPTPTGTSTPTPTPTPSGSWSGSDSPALAIVDNGSACDSLTASGSGSATDVLIDMNITSSYPLSLRATLEHNGVVADVFAAGAFDASPIAITALPVAGFTGSPTGTWTLCIIDIDAFGDTGTLNTWSVHN